MTSTSPPTDNNSTPSVISSEAKRWATAARREIVIGGHDTATPIFQPLILQALGVPQQADNPPYPVLLLAAGVDQELWNYWVEQYGTDFKNRAISQADIIYDPNQPGHITAEMQMDLLYGAWSDDYGVPLLSSLGHSQLESSDTKLMTLFTTTSAALSIARRPLTDPHRMALAMIANADRPRPVAVSTSSPTPHDSSDAIRSVCIACRLAIEPTLVTICTICNSSLHNRQTCICPCTGTQRDLPSPAETIAYSDSDDGEPHLTCNGCNRPINLDDGATSCIRCARDLHLAPDDSGPLCQCPCPILGIDSGSESDDYTPANANSCPVCCRTITSSSRNASVLEPCGHLGHWRCLLSAFTMDERCPLCRGEIQQLRDLHTGSIANDNNVPNPPVSRYEIDQLTMDLIDALERPEMYVEGDPLPTDDPVSTPASSIPILSASSVRDATSSTIPGPDLSVVQPSNLSETEDATTRDSNHNALVYPTICPINSTASCAARPFSTPAAIALHIRRTHTPLLAEQTWIVLAAGLQTCPNCNEPYARLAGHRSRPGSACYVDSHAMAPIILPIQVVNEPTFVSPVEENVNYEPSCFLPTNRLHKKVRPRAWPLLHSAFRSVFTKYADAVESEDQPARKTAFLNIIRAPALLLRHVRGGTRRLNTQLASQLSRGTDESIWTAPFPTSLPDSKEEEGKQHETNPPSTSHLNHAIRLAEELASSSTRNLGRAANVLTSPGLLLPTAPVIEQLKQLHPHAPEQESIPALPHDAPRLIIEKEAIPPALLRQCTGASPGLYGYTSEILFALSKDPECLRGIHSLVCAIANGDLTPIERLFLYAAPVLASKKSHNARPTDPPRPINTGSPLIKLAATIAVAHVQSEFHTIFPSIQFGVGFPGGPEAAIHSSNAHLRSHPDHVMLSVDFVNAFNLRHRSAILKRVLETPQLRPIWRIIFQAYSQPSLLLVRYNGSVLDSFLSQCGVKQGCVLASLLFALSVQPIFENSLSGSAVGVALIDDFNIIGSPSDVAESYGKLRYLLAQDNGGLQISVPKLRLLLPPGATFVSSHLTPLAPLLLQLDADHVFRGFMPTLGGVVYYPHSSDTATEQIASLQPGSAINTTCSTHAEMALGVASWALARAESHAPTMRALLHPGLSTASALAILNTCVQRRMSYTMRVLPPHLSMRGLHHFDNLTYRCFVSRLGISTPLPPLAQSLIRLPGRYGACCPQQTSLLAHAAYSSSLMLAISSRAIPEQQDPRRLLTTNGDFLTDSYNSLERNGVPIADIRPLLTPGIIPPAHIQSRFTHSIYSTLRNRLLLQGRDQHGPAFPALMLSAAQEGARALPFSTIPVNPELSLRDAEIEAALLARLPQIPLSGIPTTGVNCPGCQQLLTPDTATYHFLTRTCSVVGGAIIRRHDSYVKMLATFLRRCGAVVEIEPDHLHFQDATREHPDLRVWWRPANMSPPDALIDVSFASPTAQTSLRLAATTPLAAASQRELIKHRQYDQLAMASNTTLIPWVLEPTGALGREALGYLRRVQAYYASVVRGLPAARDTLADAMLDDFPRNPRGLLPYFRAMSAAETARGNARILDLAKRRLWDAPRRSH